MKPRPANSTDLSAPESFSAGLDLESAARGDAAPVPGLDYRAPAWLRNRHLQTIWPVMFAGGPRVQYRRERWSTPDGDFVDLDWATAPSAPSAPTAQTAPTAPSAARRNLKASTVVEPASTAPLVALFHGLEGDSGSHYARALMAHLLATGWRGVVINWRGCSGEPNLLARAYHSGDSAEVDWILRRLRPEFVAGVSLGANALLKWLGEQGSQAGFIRAAAGVSAPQDLQAGADALSRGFNRLYCRRFLLTLKRKSLLKLDRFPGLYDRELLLASRDFFDFDDLVTAPLHGFDSALDYWTRSSCKQHLAGIAVPTLVLNARDDPFLPQQVLARQSEVSRHVELDYPARGGHVGFVHGGPGSSGDWLPQRLTGFFRRFA